VEGGFLDRPSRSKTHLPFKQQIIQVTVKVGKEKEEIDEKVSGALDL